MMLIVCGREHILLSDTFIKLRQYCAFKQGFSVISTCSTCSTGSQMMVLKYTSQQGREYKEAWLTLFQYWPKFAAVLSYTIKWKNTSLFIWEQQKYQMPRFCCKNLRRRGTIFLLWRTSACGQTVPLQPVIMYVQSAVGYVPTVCYDWPTNKLSSFVSKYLHHVFTQIDAGMRSTVPTIDMASTMVHCCYCGWI